VGRGIDSVVLDVRGVGYKVFVPRQPGTESVVLHIHHEVRDDAQLLFGFEAPEELTLFEMLIGVPNVGPKAALSLLSSASVSMLAGAIATGDAGALARAPGVGKKTAERVIVELRTKVRGVAASPTAPVTTEDDAVAALTALGYSVAEATHALRAVPPRQETAERVQAALRAMAR
jgi:Holliday junction DNA helicase RuvA